jgi:hypothetical protein
VVVTKRNILVIVRLFFSFLTLAAIGAQLAVQIRNDFSLVNFFSYFTNLSNLFSAVVMIFGAVSLLRGMKPTLTAEVVRGASASAMTLVGIVFSLLLRDQDLGHLMPWVNTVTHYIMPVVALADWLYQPPQSRLRIEHLVYWMIFPLLYLAYSILRGKLVGFYAYPFFNPEKVGGNGGVALYCLAIAIAFLLVGWFLLSLGNKLSQKP